MELIRHVCGRSVSFSGGALKTVLLGIKHVGGHKVVRCELFTEIGHVEVEFLVRAIVAWPTNVQLK